MGEVDAPAPDLRPLLYHDQLVAYLKQYESEIWEWSASLEIRDRQSEALRADLLRETYRLSAESHPQPYTLCVQVTEKLALAAPVTLYQAGGPQMNASLAYLPGEIHVVLHGPVLERLDQAELLALLGHEIAHYRLWSERDGEIHTAERILRQTLADPRASPSHRESARLFALHTELYADRGGALAGSDPSAAIAALVKVHTGIASADPAAYLRQAEELAAVDNSTARGQTHPEIFLRAQAVDKWWRRDPTLDDWLPQRVRGPLAIGQLDLLSQNELTALTRILIAAYLRSSELVSEIQQNQVKAYFPDWSAAESDAAAELPSIPDVDLATQRYLMTVLVDLALADEELREESLLKTGRFAQRLDTLEPLLDVLKREAKLPRRELDPLTRRLRKAVEA
ncbi:MAG: M48 family metalloprotease, partial [Aliidongia sp.]